MDKRLELDALLRKVMRDVSVVENVYFQPPENLLLKYPAIVYSRSDIRNRPADDMVYSQFTFYDLTVIDKNPDSLLVYAVASLPRCKFGRHYKSDNLNHDTFTIFI